MNKSYRRVILITALIAVFVFQILPVKNPSPVKGIDKIVHFFIYFCLTFLFWWNGLSLFKSVIFAILYGILMEIVQIPVPTRDVSFFDFLANCLGTFAFLGLRLSLKRKR